MGSEGDLVALEGSALLGYRFIQAETIGKLAGGRRVHGSEWRWLDQGGYRLFARREDRPRVHLAALRPALLGAAAHRRGALFLGRRIEERVPRSDAENAWFYRYFFQVDWSDPGRYGLILDTSVLTLHESAQQLGEAVAQRGGTGSPPFRGSMAEHKAL
jgi:hypothetical protein